jgi:hypothetical protein
VSYTINPSAGVGINNFSADVILGIIRPLLVLLICNWALASGMGVPIPTFCAKLLAENNTASSVIIFFIVPCF